MYNPRHGVPAVSFAHFPSEIPVFYLQLGRGFLFILDNDALLLDIASIFLTLLLTLSMVTTVGNKSLILAYLNPLLFHLTIDAFGGLFKNSPR